jgi:uncharacterized protein
MRSLALFLAASLTLGTVSPKASAGRFESWFRRQMPATTASTIKKIWIFQEPTFVGDFNTRMAIAESFPDAQVEILNEISEPNAPAFLNARFGKTHLGTDEWPDLVVHSLAKDKEIDLLLELRKLSAGRVFLTLVDGSAHRAGEVDLVVNSHHMPQIFTGKGNVARTLGLPSRMNPERLAEGHDEYAEKLGHFPGPIVTLLVGGQAANTVFTMADAKLLGEKVRRAVKNVNGSLFVSNSRRTPDKAFQALLEELTGFPLYVHDTKKDVGNPYSAFLSYADHIIVTGDSSSMISDALTTGKPVYVHAPNSILEDRHKRFLLGLMDAGYLRLLGPELDGDLQRPLNVAADLNDLIRARRNSCAGILLSK